MSGLSGWSRVASSYHATARRLVAGCVRGDRERLERRGRERIEAPGPLGGVDRRLDPPGVAGVERPLDLTVGELGEDEHEEPRRCDGDDRDHAREPDVQRIPRPPRREQRAERGERGRGHGEEVEVVVDERVHAVGEDEAGEGAAARRARRCRNEPEPAPDTDDRGGRRRASPRPRPTTPRSARSCSGTLCGSLPVVASSRTCRRAIANVPAPVPPSGLSAGDLERLVPPGEPVVRAEVGQPAGVVLALAAPNLGRRPVESDCRPRRRPRPRPASAPPTATSARAVRTARRRSVTRRRTGTSQRPATATRQRRSRRGSRRPGRRRRDRRAARPPRRAPDA